MIPENKTYEQKYQNTKSYIYIYNQTMEDGVPTKEGYNAVKHLSDEELERNESVELPSIQDVTSGQILAEDLYTVKDIFFLVRGHMIESSDIEKMRIYEDEDNGVRNIWVQSLQE